MSFGGVDARGVRPVGVGLVEQEWSSVEDVQMGVTLESRAFDSEVLTYWTLGPCLA